MENKRYFLRDSDGQSVIEYVLLLAVVASLVIAVFKSGAFQNFYGENGQFAQVFKKEIEFNYTNSYRGREDFEEPDYRNDSHRSYQSAGGTRFFGAAEAYP